MGFRPSGSIINDWEVANVHVNDLLDLFCDSLELDPGRLTLDTEIQDVEEWTSVGWLSIMSALDEQFDLQLPAKEIRGFKKVQDLVNFVAARADVVM